MYLDTDPFLASLKADDWLETAARKATFDAPKTSVVPAVEIQLVMFESWSRSELADVCGSIVDEGVEVVTLTAGVFVAGSELLPTYPALNGLDAIHVGHARTLDESLVSTDALYPENEEFDSLDPRER